MVILTNCADVWSLAGTFLRKWLEARSTTPSAPLNSVSRSNQTMFMHSLLSGMRTIPERTMAKPRIAIKKLLHRSLMIQTRSLG